MSEYSQLSSKLEFEPAVNQVNMGRLNSGQATYTDLMDAFVRELSSEEILLISGASKAGGSYSGSSYS
jgi:hypothetical protein